METGDPDHLCVHGDFRAETETGLEACPSRLLAFMTIVHYLRVFLQETKSYFSAQREAGVEGGRNMLCVPR